MVPDTPLNVLPEAAGQRLDAWLTAQLEGVSRSRVQLLLSQQSVLVDGEQAKPSLKLRGGETVKVLAEPVLEPLRAVAENIPLDIVYEDEDLSVISKAAGMMVHAGAGATDDERNRGTLVNALLHRYSQLSTTGGDLRPGIVHRLDKDTSGLIVIARNDATHLKLGAMFAERRMHKTYLALVQGAVAKNSGTVNAPIGRDTVRRTRMTTKHTEDARKATSHYKVERRLETRFGKFTLVTVKIETGRTHQIRVHMSSIGHPVVGDKLYGAAGRLVRVAMGRGKQEIVETMALERNFLHAAELEFEHPRTGALLRLKSPLPPDLVAFLEKMERPAP